MNEPIRVLQVLGTMNRGGAENMIMNLYREIDRNKVQFDFVVHTDEECSFGEEIRSLGGKIFAAPKYTLKNHFAYKKWWKKFLKGHPEYRVIHGHMYSIASIYLGIAKKYGLVTIAHSHSTSFRKKKEALIRTALQLPLRNISDWLFACSDKAGIWLYGKNCKNRKNYLLFKNAINPLKFAYNKKTAEAVRKELGLEGKFVVGHVGSLSIPKNHTFLVDIFKEIKKEIPEAHLLLVGDGSQRQNILNKVEHYGVADSITLMGVRTDVEILLQSMDCFVFPSLYEGLPVSVVEAQAAGLPCFVSTNVTDEVCVTDLAIRLPLELGAEEWSKRIVEKKDSFVKTNMEEQIKKSGYDIKDTASWLQEFYIREFDKKLR